MREYNGYISGIALEESKLALKKLFCILNLNFYRYFVDQFQRHNMVF